MTMVEIQNITKTFASGFLGRKRTVLDGVSFELGQGEVYGLLGHNGSGKTTTMRIMLGLLRADSGSVRLFGSERITAEARSRIGFLGDEIGLYPNFNAREMIQFAGELYRMDRKHLAQRRDELLALAGLTEAANTPVKRYSKGMRQRLGVALAILNDPDLLVLDEPYSGLDPIGRRELRELLLQLKSDGKTILMSSHIVPDVEAVCDRVGILSGGRIRRSLALKDIFEQKSSPVEIIVSGVDHRSMRDVDERVEVLYANADAVALKCRERRVVKAVIARVDSLGGEILELKPLRFGLEDYLMDALQDSAGADKMHTRGPREDAYADRR